MRPTLDKQNYRTRIIASLSEVGQPAWDALVASQADANPFLSFAFLHALHESGSASQDTGWQPQYLTLWQDERIIAALPMYAKFHSYGEYVFDWAWADAYRRNGLDYYPKLLSAIPFTPVTGNRLIAIDDQARAALLQALLGVQEASGLSSTHILYPPQSEATQLEDAGFLLRKGVQIEVGAPRKTYNKTGRAFRAPSYRWTQGWEVQDPATGRWSTSMRRNDALRHAAELLTAYRRKAG
jgi:predicted N-acyltransferase